MVEKIQGKKVQKAPVAKGGQSGQKTSEKSRSEVSQKKGSDSKKK